MNINSRYVLIWFSIQCDHLKIITWNNIINEANVDLNGGDIIFARNLKEINMDDSTFQMRQEVEMSELNNHPTIYLFYLCGSRVLERVSIRNAKYRKIVNTYERVSQNMLIKFIHNSPATLKWFRSDLTQVNIEMLTKERPGIQLLN